MIAQRSLSNGFRMCHTPILFSWETHVHVCKVILGLKKKSCKFYQTDLAFSDVTIVLQALLIACLI